MRALPELRSINFDMDDKKHSGAFISKTWITYIRPTLVTFNLCQNIIDIVIEPLKSVIYSLKSP